MARWPYSDKRWLIVRKAVLIRDRGVCQIRGPRCRTVATQVDHVLSVSQGGAPFDPANLRASCGPCNIRKRNQEVAARARGDAPPAQAPANPTSRQW